MSFQPLEDPDAQGSNHWNLMKHAWLVVALLMPVALLNYLDRQMLAAMKTSIIGDLSGFDQETLGKQWGQILAQFKWMYAFLSPIGGYIADRFGRRRTICASLFAWSAVTWWTGHVHSYETLLWARTLMGISEAFYIPAALAMITDYHTGSTRSKAVGLHQIGIYLGVITGSFAGYVADAPALGWRWGFDVCGIVGMVYAIPLALLLRDRPPAKADEGHSRSPGASVKELLTNPSFLLLVLYFTLPAMAGWVVRDWGPSIMKERYNIGQGQAGVSATLYWQVAAIFGAIIGGMIADRWMKRSIRGRIFTSAIGMSMIIPAMFGVGNADKSLYVAVAFLALFGLGWGFFDCNNMPILSQIARPHLRATGYGIMNLVSISIGGYADIMFGWLRDRHVSDNVIFTAFSAIAVVSVVIVLLIRPKETNGDAR